MDFYFQKLLILQTVCFKYNNYQPYTKGLKSCFQPLNMSDIQQSEYGV